MDKQEILDTQDEYNNHNLSFYDKVVSDNVDNNSDMLYIEDDEYIKNEEYNISDSDELGLYAKIYQQNSIDLLEPDEEDIDEPDDFEGNL